MKSLTHIQSGKVVLVALGLLVSTLAVEPAVARQSERARERTPSTRVERRSNTKNDQRATKPSVRTPQESRAAAKAPARNERSTAAQRAPARNERGTAAQQAPSRTGRVDSAPARNQRGTAAQQAPSRTGRVDSAPARNQRGTAAQQAPSRTGRVDSAPARNQRGTAAQQAPSRTGRVDSAPARTGRGTAAQQSPSRTGRVDSAPARTGRGTAAQQAPSRTGRVDSAPARNNGNRGNRVSFPGERRTGKVVFGDRSRLVRRDIRSIITDRTHVVPRYRYRPYVNVWSRPVIRSYWPLIHVHLDWPWLVRYERHWAPRYRYRQVIRVEVYHDGRRDWSNVEVETYYRHSVRRATADWAEIDIEIDQIDVYDGNRYLGYVDRLPGDLKKIRATVYRNGDIRFDREVFLVGDPFVGFEVISTRHYDGWAQDNYRPDDGYRAGRVDLGRHRVQPIRRSRLWDPYRYTGVVPVSLLPDQQGWLWDYGVEALSAVYDDYDYYYGGTGAVAPRGPSEDPGLLYGADEWSYKTRDGADVRYERESNLERVR